MRLPVRGAWPFTNEGSCDHADPGYLQLRASAGRKRLRGKSGEWSSGWSSAGMTVDRPDSLVRVARGLDWTCSVTRRPAYITDEAAQPS